MRLSLILLLSHVLILLMTLKHLSAKAETRAVSRFLLVGFLLKTSQTVDIFVTFFRDVVLSLLNNLICACRCASSSVNTSKQTRLLKYYVIITIMAHICTTVLQKGLECHAFSFGVLIFRL